MYQVNILEAKTNFSKLLMLLETKQESEIIICKNNKPVAKIEPIEEKSRIDMMGIAKGKWSVPDNFDDGDEEIIKMFYGSVDEEW